MRRQTDANTKSKFRRRMSPRHFDQIPSSKRRRVPAGTL